MADENQSGDKQGDEATEKKQKCLVGESESLNQEQKDGIISERDCSFNGEKDISKDTNKDESKCIAEEKMDESLEDESKAVVDMIHFRIIWNKQNYDVTFDPNETVRNLKKHIETLTGLPVLMQKLMFKGLVKDDTQTLSDLKVTNNTKMMVIGSTMKDILNIQPSAKSLKEDTSSFVTSKEPWSKQKMHKKILDKGKPEDVMPGDKSKKEPLPRTPISGMLNKAAGKVRLTFKLELDQLWIGTKERTEKVSMGSIKKVLSEPIEGHEDYHVIAIQLGPTEASRYWVYWVPAQYVDAIKDTILGKWQAF